MLPKKIVCRVSWSEDDREHVGLCDAFPSMSCLAPSHDEALRGIMALVADIICEDPSTVVVQHGDRTFTVLPVEKP